MHDETATTVDARDSLGVRHRRPAERSLGRAARPAWTCSRRSAACSRRATARRCRRCSVREQDLVTRLQACHDRRQRLLAQAADEGLPSDSIRSLSKSLPANSRNRLRGELDEAQQRSRLLAARVPHQLGASTADAVTSFAIDRDYCYRRSHAADIWKWLDRQGHSDEALVGGALVDRAV